jgi:dihydrofolate reductase
MTKVVADISMSLDGFVTGPDDSPEQGLGVGGERLHEWIFNLASWREQHGLEGGEDNRDSQRMEEALQNIGALVMGRRMFDHGIRHWGDNPPFHNPVLVLTHRPQEPLVKEGGTTFTFIDDSIENAVAQAQAAAGDKNVAIAGGASAIQQALRAGVLDELEIHLVPVLMGDGVRLFDRSAGEQVELELARLEQSPDVTHLKFRIIG